MVILLLWFFLQKHFKPAWYEAMIMLAIMTLAGIFYDVGWIVVLVMLGSAIQLVLMIKDRKSYLIK